MIHNERTEILVLKSLIHSQEFLTKAFPYIKAEYFQDYYERLVFESIRDLITKYNCNPTVEMLLIHFYEKNNLEDSQYVQVKSIVELLAEKTATKMQWLLETAESWCQNQAYIYAVTKAAEIATGDAKNLSKTDIPEIFKDALGVSFDAQLGISYLDDGMDRFQQYTNTEDKLLCDIDYINRATSGGFEKKSLNVFMGTPGAGKSLVLCSLASAFLMRGKSVCYITLEMSANHIAKRIDSNLFNIPIKNLAEMSPEDLSRRLEHLKKSVLGRLFIKEYPTSSATVNHFRQYLKELEMKKNFKPDIIMIDYINIARSTRMKSSSDQYAMVKSIAEEIRGLAGETGAAIFSATQTNRSGFNDSEVDMDSVSESWGLPATTDFFAALITTEELDQGKKIIMKVLKNRYNELGPYRKFLVGVDKPYMRLFNIDGSYEQQMKKEVKTSEELPKVVQRVEELVSFDDDMF